MSMIGPKLRNGTVPIVVASGGRPVAWIRLSFTESPTRLKK